MSVATAIIDVFVSYSHKDESLRDELVTHLSLLERSKVIRAWHDRRIGAGEDWKAVVDQKLESAGVILLLISSDFLASDYCYDIEMERSLERHRAGEAVVIPIILRTCNWSRAPFAMLQALPRDAKPVTNWPDRDSAWTDVVAGIEAAIGRRAAGSSVPFRRSRSGRPRRIARPHAPASSPRLNDPVTLRKVLQKRRLQVALDVSDLDAARHLADVAIEFGVDFLEIGDPLIRRFGMQAVRQIRADHPATGLVVEFASPDWADEQVRIAAEAGADIVTLLGLRGNVQIERTVHAARTAGVCLFLELPSYERTFEWCRAVADHGVDGIAVIRNIDTATSPSDAFRRVRAVRRATDIPIAVSGGFTLPDVARAMALSWNIMIVGRAIVEAPEPAAVVRAMASLIHGEKK